MHEKLQWRNVRAEDEKFEKEKMRREEKMRQIRNKMPEIKKRILNLLEKKPGYSLETNEICTAVGIVYWKNDSKTSIEYLAVKNVLDSFREKNNKDGIGFNYRVTTDPEDNGPINDRRDVKIYSYYKKWK